MRAPAPDDDTDPRSKLGGILLEALLSGGGPLQRAREDRGPPAEVLTVESPVVPWPRQEPSEIS